MFLQQMLLILGVGVSWFHLFIDEFFWQPLYIAVSAVARFVVKLAQARLTFMGPCIVIYFYSRTN